MWFLDESIAQQIEKAKESGMQFTADERVEITARSAKFGMLEKSGNTAKIRVEGVLTDKPNIIAAFLGGGNTTYPGIINAIGAANADPDIEHIDMRFKTSGGNVDGMFPAIEAVANSSKPIRAIVDKALSAGFALASNATEVVATGKGSMLGSVGTAFEMIQSPDMVAVSNTDSPKKRPDLKTEEGKAAIREQLDSVFDLFAESIASGRNTDSKDVRKNYGQGAVVLAEDALKRGMIDSIGVESDKPKQTANGGKTAEVRSMDLTQLKTEHPDVYAAAVEVGKKEERERVCAHLKMGEAAEALEIAHAAIKDGAEMTASLTADYNAAILKRSAIANREADNQEIQTPAEPKVPTAEDALDKEIVAAMGGNDDGEGVWL
jgi:ClpP class serine protease